jgi:hypothetical protein
MRKAAFIAAGVVTLLSVGIYLYYGYLGDLDSEIAQLQFTESELQQSLKDGEPVMKANAELQEWLVRDVHMLLELEKMQDTLPGTAVAYLNEYHFDVTFGKNLAKVNGKGMATSRDEVEHIYGDFDAAGFNVYPDEIEISRGDPDYPAEFTLTLERPAESNDQTTNSRIRSTR